MVSSFRFLWVANTPILDHLQLVESLDYVEFAFILFILIHVLEHTVIIGAIYGHLLSSHVLHTLSRCHAHPDTIRSYISCTKQWLKIIVSHEILAFIWRNRWDIRSHGVPSINSDGFLNHLESWHVLLLLLHDRLLLLLYLWLHLDLSGRLHPTYIYSQSWHNQDIWFRIISWHATIISKSLELLLLSWLLR